MCNFGFCNLAALHDEAVPSFSGTWLFKFLILLVMAVLHREEDNSFTGRFQLFYNRKKADVS
jgi:hypothetical protein